MSAQILPGLEALMCTDPFDPPVCTDLPDSHCLLPSLLAVTSLFHQPCNPYLSVVTHLVPHPLLLLHSPACLAPPPPFLMLTVCRVSGLMQQGMQLYRYGCRFN